MPIDPFHIVKSTIGEVEIIGNKIESYNNSRIPFTQTEHFIDLNFSIKDDIGVVIAGITSCLYCWSMLYVDVLAVDQKYHKKAWAVNYSLIQKMRLRNLEQL